jgi:phage terminase small subunit
MGQRAKSKPREDRRERFAQEYAKDLNGTQAAIRAGYGAKCAKVTASRLLSDVNVQASVQQILAKVAQKNEITVERTLKEIARIAYGDRRKLYDEKGGLRHLHELDEDTAALIAELESDELFGGSGAERVQIGIARKVKTWSKSKALDQCMAYLGMHKTQQPTEGGGLALTINLSNGKKAR